MSQTARLIWLLAALGGGAIAAHAGDLDAPTSESAALPPVDAVPAQDALPEGTALSGRDIYERVIRNRSRIAFQSQRLLSSDPGGDEQQTDLKLHWKDFTDESGQPTEDVRWKALVKYTSPESMRGAGYLFINREDSPSDQFVYHPSRRKTRRVNVSDAIMGTDFNLEDIIPRRLDGSDYTRQPDDQIDGVPCYVVEIVPRPDSASRYGKLRVWIEKQSHVTVRTRYWDPSGVEIKEYTASPLEIREISGVFIPHEATMTNLLERTSTRMIIDEVDENPDLRDSVFSMRQLQRRR